MMSISDLYQKSVEANILLSAQAVEEYHKEPHYRPENVAKVEAKLVDLIRRTTAKRMLDLGCGTGFMIDIAKKYLEEIIGIDVSQAMLEKVDTTGPAKIQVLNHDSGTFLAQEGYFDLATAYSFLHHLYDIVPTLRTAYLALKKGGIFYADLEPNYYFWQAIHTLERGKYDPIVNREIEEVTYKNEDIESRFGIDAATYHLAEYGKNVLGGFKEETLKVKLQEIGFIDVSVFYYWFIGQGQMINDYQYSKEERFKYAEMTDRILQRALPVSRGLYKYLGLIAVK